MNETGVYVASVDELIDVFRQGLLALIPVAERAQVTWRYPDAYDDWDEFYIRSYAEFSWIEFDSPDAGDSAAFVGLRSDAEPFDTLYLVQVDPESGKPGDSIEVPWRDHGFALRRRFVDGTSERVTEVRVDW
jgi:hypothetical protein